MTTLNALSTTGLLFRTHLASLLTSKRALVCLLLAGVPVLIALVAAHEHHASRVSLGIITLVLLMFVGPMIGLLLGSTVITEEVENRTLTYAFTRPVHRGSLFLGRWLATAVLAAGIMGSSSLAVTTITSTPRAGDATAHRDYDRREKKLIVSEVRRDLPEGLAIRGAVAASLVGVLYSLLTGFLGIFLKRPMILGLGYAFAIEGLLANIPISTQRLSLQYYLRGIVFDVDETGGSPLLGRELFESMQLMDLETSLTRLLVILLLGLTVALWAVRRRQFVLTA